MSKSKTGAKVAIGILAAALLIGGLGAATRGFRNWDPQTWFDNWGKGDESSSEDTVEEGENLQLRVFGGPKFAATAQVGDTKTATATVIPSNATDKRVTWVSSDPTKVSVANKYTNSGEANTIRLESLFAGEVTVTAYPTLLGPEKGAAITVTFGNAPQTMYGNAFLAQTEQVGIEHFAEQMSGVWDWLDGERTEPLQRRRRLRQAMGQRRDLHQLQRGQLAGIQRGQLLADSPGPGQGGGRGASGRHRPREHILRRCRHRAHGGLRIRQGQRVHRLPERQ